MKFILSICLLFILNLGFTQTNENIFIITLDGFRWQELYGGAVDSMMNNKDLTHDERVYSKYHAETQMEARQKLLPWIWTTLAQEGTLYGNRWHENRVNCTNRFWFSYPGYNEILTGFSDPNINSNAKKYNENITVLEWLNENSDYKGKVAAFGSWDVFPFIINDKRSGIPVNAGFMKAQADELTEKETILNELQDQIPSPWSSVRLDAFTHHYMMEYIQKHHPRVVYISYGETDDFAHDGRYDHYLNSAHQTDQWIGELWTYIQQDPVYKGKTTLLITTDHGRGHSPMTEWKSHGTIYKGSNEIWVAAIGPNIKNQGEVKEKMQLFQSQIAKTAAYILGLSYSNDKHEVGEVIQDLMIKTN